jgi:hypothetical protein
MFSQTNQSLRFRLLTLPQEFSVGECGWAWQKPDRAGVNFVPALALDGTAYNINFGDDLIT